MIIGLAKEAVRVVDYQPGWETLYQQEAQLLRSTLKEAALRVEHIGSTSIVGMEAKPIIDLMVAIPNLKEAHVLVPDLEALGYEFLSDEPPPDRMFFAKGPHLSRTHHLSLAELTSEFYENMILFRDYLKSHSEVAEAYRTLKKDLSTQYPHQRPFYTTGKQTFVEHVLQMARTAT